MTKKISNLLTPHRSQYLHVAYNEIEKGLEQKTKN